MIHIKVLIDEFALSERYLNKYLYYGFGSNNIYYNSRILRDVVHFIRNRINHYKKLPILEYDNIKNMIATTIEFARISGVYFLFDGDEIVYVGQSVNVLNRVTSHFYDKKFDKVALLRVPEKDLLAIESIYIKKFLPKYNLKDAGSSDLQNFFFYKAVCEAKNLLPRREETESIPEYKERVRRIFKYAVGNKKPILK
jgi:hypothetical protein